MCDNNNNIKYFSPYQWSSFLSSSLFFASLSITESESKAMIMSFSVAINIKASNLSDERVLLSLFLTNFRIENVRSQATCVRDNVSRY